MTLPSRTLFRDLKNEFLSTRAALLNEYLSTFSKLAHERRYVFPLLEEFLSEDVYTNKKKAIQKKVDSLVTPFKTASRNAAQVMVDAPGQFLASLKSQAESVKQKIVPSANNDSKDEVEEKWLLSFRNALDEIFNLYGKFATSPDKRWLWDGIFRGSQIQYSQSRDFFPKKSQMKNSGIFWDFCDRDFFSSGKSTKKSRQTPTS